ncbi:hypothetical protein PG993_003806 [Apiospora rasikravindrae]|uniref:Uncharacterized protein n=1 Tax=Apiospora rasikravindrae TaxID=990691 RepID=A0ABR1U0J4_9PEZI
MADKTHLLACGMMCCLNIIPIVFMGLQATGTNENVGLAENGGLTENDGLDASKSLTNSEVLDKDDDLEKLRATNKVLRENMTALQQRLAEQEGVKTAMEQQLKAQEKLEDELALVKRRHRATQNSLQQLIREMLQDADRIRAEWDEGRAERHTELGNLREYVGEMETELKDLQMYIPEVENENYDLYNDLVETRDQLRQTEVDTQALRNVVVNLLLEIRRLQATQPGLFRRIRDSYN